MNVTESVTEIAQPVVEGLGVELIDVEYIKEGSRWVLRLYIDKRGGVGLDDCETVSRAVEPLLDEADIIKSAYTFEVSSPGLERPLKTDNDFARYQGEMVELSLYAPRDGEKKFTGELIGKQDGVVTLMCDGGEMQFNAKDISVIKRTVVW